MPMLMHAWRKCKGLNYLICTIKAQLHRTEAKAFFDIYRHWIFFDHFACRLVVFRFRLVWMGPYRWACSRWRYSFRWWGRRHTAWCSPSAEPPGRLRVPAGLTGCPGTLQKTWMIKRREWVARTRTRRMQSMTIGHAIFNNLRKMGDNFP